MTSSHFTSHPRRMLPPPVCTHSPEVPPDPPLPACNADLANWAVHWRLEDATYYGEFDAYALAVDVGSGNWFGVAVGSALIGGVLTDWSLVVEGFWPGALCDLQIHAALTFDFGAVTIDVVDAVLYAGGSPFHYESPELQDGSNPYYGQMTVDS